MLSDRDCAFLCQYHRHPERHRSTWRQLLMAGQHLLLRFVPPIYSNCFNSDSQPHRRSWSTVPSRPTPSATSLEPSLRCLHRALGHRPRLLCCCPELRRRRRNQVAARYLRSHYYGRLDTLHISGMGNFTCRCEMDAASTADFHLISGTRKKSRLCVLPGGSASTVWPRSLVA